ERGMSLPDFGLYATEHPEVDVELDARLAGIAQKGGVVIESRLAGWIVRNEGLAAVTVWIDCDPAVRAARVAEPEGTSPAPARAENDERQRVERQRYLATYGIDLADLSIYDLVLDSTTATPDDLAGQVVDRMHKLFGPI